MNTRIDFDKLKIGISIFLIGFFMPLKAQNVDFSRQHFPNQSTELKKAQKNIQKGDAYYYLETRGGYGQALEYYLPANHFNPSNALLNYKLGVCYLMSFHKNMALSYLEKARKLDSLVDPKLMFHLGMALQFHSRYREARACYEAYRRSLDQTSLLAEGTLIEKRLQECASGTALSARPNIVRFDNLAEKVNSVYDEYCPVVDAKERTMAFTSRRKSSVGQRINNLDGLYFEDIYFTFKDYSNAWDYPENPGEPLNGKANDATVEISGDGNILTVYKNIKGKDYICESKKENNLWTTPVKLDPEINRTQYHQPSATYTSNRQAIIYVSDQGGGLGGSDLYYSEMQANGAWSASVNMGRTINSLYDEEAPFLLNDSTLYFSSKGWNSVGGYDVYLSRKKDGQWGEPVNMGIPLNSPCDDLYMVVSPSGEYYLSSDRAGGHGGFDIYHVNLNLTPEELLAIVRPVYIHGSITDEDTKQGVTALVDIHDSTGVNLVPNGTSDPHGQFVASLTSMNTYDLLVQPTLCDSVVFPVGLLSGTAYHRDYALDIVDTLPRTVIRGRLRDFKNGNPLRFPVEVSDMKNQVVAARIMPDSLGQFTVELPSSASYKVDIYTRGCLHEPYAEVLPENYNVSMVDGMQIRLENVYFDFDRAEIRTDAAEILNRHALLFRRFTNWKILVSGHTDNMGSEEYNAYLSQRRSKSVVDYLVSRGVKKNQFRIVWHGYEQPATSNQSEEGRQLNRRCEFTIQAR